MSRSTQRRVFITGVSGFLGLNAALQWRNQADLAGSYRSHAVSVPGVETVELDLEDRGATLDVIARYRPEVILHTAALADVDRCETNPVQAARLNVGIAQTVAKAAVAAGARLLHISTDHLWSDEGVFHDETSPPAPLNVYARTKLEAERAVQQMCPTALIVRTNFVGWGTSNRVSFFDRIYRALDGGAPVRMFADVFFTPMAVNDLLDCLLDLAETEARGVLNVAGSQRLSKFDFAVATAQYFGYSSELVERSTVNEAALEARRARDLSLSTARASRLLGRQLPDADAAIQRLKDLRETGWTEELERAVRPSAEKLAIAGDQKRPRREIRQLSGGERT